MSEMLHADDIFVPYRVRTASTAVPALRAILHDVEVFIRRFVVLSDEQAIAVALWTAHTRPIEAAEAIGVGRSKIYELLASGELPSIRIGGSVRVPVDALRAWIARQLAEPTGAGR